MTAQTAVKDIAPVVFAPLLAYRPARTADEIAVTASSAGAVAFEFRGALSTGPLSPTAAKLLW